MKIGLSLLTLGTFHMCQIKDSAGAEVERGFIQVEVLDLEIQSASGRSRPKPQKWTRRQLREKRKRKKKNKNTPPTSSPTVSRSDIPSFSTSPSDHPSDLPSEIPSETPTLKPSEKPSASPSEIPSEIPSEMPSMAPSKVPSFSPIGIPTGAPSALPSISTVPSLKPSAFPSEIPSTSLAPTVVPSLSSFPSDLPSTSGPALKSGLIINPKVSLASAENFNGKVSWFYNYKHTPVQWQGEWADKNDVEFIPMIPQPWLWGDNTLSSGKRCFFDPDEDNVCTVDDVIDVLEKAKDARKDGVAVKSLMGFNEMYNNEDDLTPGESALYWGMFVQPAAIATGLSLISPTLNAKPGASGWFSDFLKRCYDLKDHGAYPCDVNLIAKFAVHQYDCREWIWNDWYGGSNSVMIESLITNMGNYCAEDDCPDWSAYVRDRELWVTETNCYWETKDPTPTNWIFEYPHASSKEQCMRTTGQMSATHGGGSIAKMEELDNIERYAWWTTWNDQIKPNYLTYKDGQLTPVGKAYLNPGNSTIDCEFPGTKIFFNDANKKSDLLELYGRAQIMDCKSTKTEMVKRLGRDGSTAALTVVVTEAGDYAVNVSFLSKGNRPLTVQVNTGEVKEFMFVSSSQYWCNDKGGGIGTTTVLPIELEGFVEGENTITFGGGDLEKNMPLLEWISIVPK